MEQYFATRRITGIRGGRGIHAALRMELVGLRRLENVGQLSASSSPRSQERDPLTSLRAGSGAPATCCGWRFLPPCYAFSYADHGQVPDEFAAQVQARA